MTCKPQKLNASIIKDIGIVSRFDTPFQYQIGETDVKIGLQYHAWPSVCADENGVLYAFASGRLHHIDPFGQTMMYKSYDNGDTWSEPIVINDTPMDDRDTGVVYMGNGKMLVTYFRIDAANLMAADQSIVTKDGVTVTGERPADRKPNGDYMDDYVAWQNIGYYGIQPEHVRAVLDHFASRNADELSGGCWSLLSLDYGKTWSAPRPTPVSSPHGPIMLSNGRLLYVGRGFSEDTGGDGVYAYTSDDDGESWQYVTQLCSNEGSSELTFCEPHVVELESGRLIAALRVQVSDTTIVEGENTYVGIGTGFARDTGEVIYSVLMDPVAGKYQCYVAKADGSGYQRYDGIGTLAANRYGYAVYTCYSDDGGATWTTPKMATDCDGNPLYGTPPHLIRLKNGVVVMTLCSRESSDRGQLAILSYDGGMTWDKTIVLCKWVNGTEDIGYPATCMTADGNLLTVYYQSYADKNDGFSSLLYSKWSLK